MSPSPGLIEPPWWSEERLAVDRDLATNSIKRLNNDAAVKAGIWLDQFGTMNVVPTAVLSGVYKLKHLLAAQVRGLAVFWAHDLARMVAWIESTRR